MSLKEAMDALEQEYQRYKDSKLKEVENIFEQINTYRSIIDAKKKSIEYTSKGEK